MKAKDKIIKIISGMSGKYSAYTVFRDWVECSALAVQNSCSLFHDSLWKAREEQYLNVIKKYNEEERALFSEMLYLLCEALDESIEDVLGDVYMRSGCYSKQLGQFFTPFHLANLLAEVGIPDDISEDNVYTINEPSVGGGANVIGLAKTLKEKGVNFQKCLEVTAQDLDWLSVYMSYLQFSLLGINAEVVQGDSLCDPYRRGYYPPERVFKTPTRMGVLV